MPDSHETLDSGLLVNRQNIPFSLDAGVSDRAALGLIVLATDHSIEYEWRNMLGAIDGIGFYENRIMNEVEINPDSLKAMEARLTQATAEIRPGERIDVMAYGCTAGALMIGDDNVAARIQEARPGVACTTPMKATIAGLKAMGCRRVALLTPYLDEINHTMRNHLLANGVEVPVMGSFNHSNDNEVARIDSGSIERAALELGAHESVDCVFVSCTNLRVAHLIEGLEAKLGKPVTASNHALAWHALRLAGYVDPLPGWGRLMRV